MKRLLPLLLLLAAGSASAQVYSIYCDAATQTACNTTTPYNGSYGDAWWLWAGKDNANTQYFCGLLGVCTSDTGGIVVSGATGGAKGAGTINAAGLYINGVAVGTGGTGTVTDGSGTTTANELLLSSTTAHAYTNATTLPTSALPALAGDVTSSAGSNSVTVSKVNGASIPVSASLTNTNASGQFGSVTVGSGMTSFLALAWPTLVASNCLTNNGTALSWGACGSGSMVYPGAGIAVSTGSAWGTSINGSSNTLVGNAGSGQAALTPAQVIGILNSASANAQTGTTYTFVLGDANGEVTMNNAASNTVTIPPNSSVAYAVGTLLTVQELGAGVTTLSPGSGVTITSAAYGSSTSQTYSLGGAYGFIQIQQTATNTWNVVAWDTPANQKLAALSSEMQAYLSASTQFTYSATGCTPSAAVGGPFAGKITLAATCTQIVVTLNGATGFTDTNGYTCTMADDTLQAAGTWFGTWPANSTTSTTATFAIPPAAGATDTVSFACHPRSL